MHHRTVLSSIAIYFMTMLAAYAQPLTFQLEVQGLQCPLCAFGIEKEILKISSVERVNVDISNDIVLVTFAEAAEQDAASLERELREAAGKAGFEPRRIELVSAQQ